MTIRPDEILVYVGGAALQKFGALTRRTALPTRGGEDTIETFARTSVGTFVDRNGVLRPAAAGVPRMTWLDLDGDGVREPYLLLEGARTNVALRSEEFENAAYTDVGTPVVTANATAAPDSTTTGDEINDDNAAAREGRRQTFTVPNDNATWTASVFIKNNGGPIAVLRLGFSGGTVLTYDLQWDPAAGAVSVAASVNAPTVYGVESLGNSWYWIWVGGPNNASGNVTAQVTVFPAWTATLGGAADDTRTGIHRFWGLQFEQGTFPSSYMKTTTASVSRAADLLTVPYPWGPMAASYYARFVELAVPNWVAVGSASPRIAHLAQSTDTGIRLIPAYKPAGGALYGTFHSRDGSASVTSTVALNPTRGDPIELLTKVYADGSVQILGRKNGGNITSGAQSAAHALASQWAGQVLTLGNLDASNGAGDIALRAFIATRGIHEMAEFEALLP